MAGHESGTNFVCLRDMDLRLQMLLLLWRRLLLLLLLWRLHRWRLIEFKVGSTLCCVLMVLSKTCPRVAALTQTCTEHNVRPRVGQGGGGGGLRFTIRACGLLDSAQVAPSCGCSAGAA